MNLEECYEAIDSDYDDVMRRLGRKHWSVNLY